MTIFVFCIVAVSQYFSMFSSFRSVLEFFVATAGFSEGWHHVCWKRCGERTHQDPFCPLRTHRHSGQGAVNSEFAWHAHAEKEAVAAVHSPRGKPTAGAHPAVITCSAHLLVLRGRRGAGEGHILLRPHSRKNKFVSCLFCPVGWMRNTEPMPALTRLEILRAVVLNRNLNIDML